jgi:hypothetical protein
MWKKKPSSVWPAHSSGNVLLYTGGTWGSEFFTGRESFFFFESSLSLPRDRSNYIPVENCSCGFQCHEIFVDAYDFYCRLVQPAQSRQRPGRLGRGAHTELAFETLRREGAIFLFSAMPVKLSWYQTAAASAESCLRRRACHPKSRVKSRNWTERGSEKSLRHAWCHTCH